MTIVGVRSYAEGVYDLVTVSADEAHLAYCADCGRADCPRWLGDHRAATGHERVYFVRPQRQQAITRETAVTPVAAASSRAYSLTCFFGIAHSAPDLTGSVRCNNCGSLVEAAAA